MRNLQTLRELFHAQFLHVRNCNNLIQSDNFEIAYKMADEKERDEILLAIAETNKEKLRLFIDLKLSKGNAFEQLGIRKLQEIAAHMKIAYYKSMDKTQLVEGIKNVAEKLKADSKRKHLQSKQTDDSGEDYFGGWGHKILVDKSTGTFSIRQG